MSNRNFRYTWEWPLRSTPEQLWPYVSDTQRFNRVAVGYAVESLAEDEVGVQQVRAHYFVPLAWDEYPFEWEAPHRMSVYRRFRGPILRDFTVTATLTPNSPGTLLCYAVSVRPASLLGSLAIPVQIGVISRRKFEQAFRRIDDFLQDPITYHIPFHTRPPFLTDDARQRIQAVAQQLASDGYPREIIQRLADFLMQAEDDEAAHIRPFALADHWGVARRAVLEVCLAATRRSLLDLRWEVICPMCRGASLSVPQLQDIRSTAHCPSCHMDYRVDFDHALEVIFQPNAAIRRVEVAAYCVGGPHLTPHVLVQQFLQPDETRIIETAFEPGAHRIRARANLPQAVSGHIDVRVSTDTAEQPARAAQLTLTTHGFQLNRATLAPRTSLTIHNRTPQQQGIVIERVRWNDQVVTASELSTVQDFRDWFATQALPPDVQLGITNVALLFTDLRGSTQLYRLIGDAPAFERVREHFDVLRTSVENHQGALIKTIGDAIMAAFIDPAAGVAAGLDILRSMAQLNQTRSDHPLRLKLGLHAGPAIAVTLNERLDYFGTTVNIASRLEGQAQGDDLIISAAVRRDPAVQRLLQESQSHLEEFSTHLKGFVDEEFQLYRVTLHAA